LNTTVTAEIPAREVLRTSSKPGKPAMARSIGALTRVSTSSGPSASAGVSTCTCTFVTSGTASIGTLLAPTKPRITNTHESTMTSVR